VAQSADAVPSKGTVLRDVWVRVPPAAFVTGWCQTLSDGVRESPKPSQFAGDSGGRNGLRRPDRPRGGGRRFAALWATFETPRRRVSQGPQAGSCGLSGGLTWGSRRPSSPGAGPGGVKARRGTLRHRSVPRTSRRRARFKPRAANPYQLCHGISRPGERSRGLMGRRGRPRVRASSSPKMSSTTLAGGQSPCRVAPAREDHGGQRGSATSRMRMGGVRSGPARRASRRALVRLLSTGF
jgi:hypothetical protein